MKILFVCHGNTCRSPMAEGLFKQLSSSSAVEFAVSSAGVGAVNGDAPATNAVNVCKALGVDISGHKARNIQEVDITKKDLLVVMTMSQAQALMQCGIPQNKIYILNVPDPFGGDMEIYKACCDAIKTQLEILLEYIEQDNRKEKTK